MFNRFIEWLIDWHLHYPLLALVCLAAIPHVTDLAVYLATLN
jgi:hypothetical protein